MDPNFTSFSENQAKNKFLHRPATAWVAAILCLLLTLAMPWTIHAQVVGGSIAGAVRGESGAAMPGVHVSSTDTTSSAARTVITDTDGFYNVPDLPPGVYEMSVSAPGFVTQVMTSIAVAAGAERSLNFVMRAGDPQQVVRTVAPPSQVSSASSTVGGTVGASIVRDTPINGRDWAQLATLQAGVTGVQNGSATGGGNTDRGFGAAVSISGSRPDQNSYRLDGISINDYANGAPGSVLGDNLGIDAVEQVSVLGSNYPADYGRTSGGVINVVTRSGKNAFHGSLYEFLRNSALDARNFFDDTKIPSFKRNQFGGSIGGPIIKNRTFFFADYEGIRQSKGITAVTTVPSLDARNGILNNGNPPVASCPPGTTLIVPGQSNVCVDNQAILYLPFFHLPNAGPTANPDIAEYSFAGQQVVNENFVTTRLDHKISEKDNLSGTYMFDKTPYTSPDGVNDVLLGSNTSRQIVAVEETHLFKTNVANSVRFGYNHEIVNNNQGLSALVPEAADTSLGTFSGRTAPQVFITGITPFLGGVGGESAYYYGWNSFQVHDDAFINKGTHTIKFGGTVERMLLNIRALSDPNGIFKFSGLQAFYQNQPGRFQGGIASSLSPRNLRQTLFGVYVQDDWRWKPNLTLNLGLRYEMATVPTEVHSKLANLRNLSDANPHL